MYDAIIKRDLRDYLIKRKVSMPNAEQQEQERRTTKTVDYKEKSDRQYFAELEKKDKIEKKDDEAPKHAVLENAVKQVNSLHLQNLVMQLRKVCNHPFLFDWPLDPKTNAPVLNNELAAQSGKVLLLDRLLTALFDRGHKVLVFSQMTKMLDILEDWATEMKGWKICRLDGSVPQESRRQQIEEFSDPRSDTKLFLLSTRAGGLGINLTAADTVVIFDSDWVKNDVLCFISKLTIYLESPNGSSGTRSCSSYRSNKTRFDLSIGCSQDSRSQNLGKGHSQT